MTLIACTLPQAAEMVGRSVRTIEQWIKDGRLVAIRSPIDRRRYVHLQQVRDVEQTLRARQTQTRRVSP